MPLLLLLKVGLEVGAAEAEPENDCTAVGVSVEDAVEVAELEAVFELVAVSVSDAEPELVPDADAVRLGLAVTEGADVAEDEVVAWLVAVWEADRVCKDVMVGGADADALRVGVAVSVRTLDSVTALVRVAVRLPRVLAERWALADAVAVADRV